MKRIVAPHRALVIGAKAPVPGTVKTRLGRTIGHDRAASLYHAFLRDTAARFAHETAFDVFWAYAPDTADWEAIIGAPSPAFPQEGADWTARQRHIFGWTAAHGYEQTVLIASDSPQLVPLTVLTAFHTLDAHDAVLLPTYDGGYSLIGQRRGVDILGTIPMSTSTVFDDLMQAASHAGIAAEAMPATWDIDEAHDLMHLARYLSDAHDAPATASAFARLDLAGCLTSAFASEPMQLVRTGGAA